MKVVERRPQEAVAEFRMEVQARVAIVPEVREAASIQIKGVWPLRLVTTCGESDQIVVGGRSADSEPALYTDLEQARQGVLLAFVAAGVVV